MYALLFYKDGKPKRIQPFEEEGDALHWEYVHKFSQIYGMGIPMIARNKLLAEYQELIECNPKFYDNRVVRVTWEQY